MNNALRVGDSVLRCRGGIGQARHQVKLLYVQSGIFLLLVLAAGVFMRSEFWRIVGDVLTTTVVAGMPIVAAGATFIPFETTNVQKVLQR